MVTNHRTGTYPIVLHATGRNGRTTAWALLKQEVLRELAASPPAPVSLDVTFDLFTWSSLEELTCLERCCQAIETGLMILRIPDPAIWTNVLKVPLTIEFLEASQADYIIGLDALDILLLAHPSEIVQRFRAKFEPVGTRLLFNASCFPWPRREGTPADACMAFEMEKFDETDRHLNAGAWIGEREYALSFWREVQALLESEDWPHVYRYSEQMPVRTAAFPDCYPEVDIDRRCRIFQHMEGGKRDLRALDPERLTSSTVN